MADQVKKNINIRAGHRAVVTKKIQKANDLTENYEESNENDLKAVEQILREKMETLKCFDELILNELDSTEMSFEIEQASEITEKINVCLFKIEKYLKKPEISKFNTSLSTSMSTSTSNKKGVRLPKLELKKYSGDPKMWQTWWDGFNSSIHENEDLTDIDRFNYLRSLLQGPAAHAILGLGLSAENYGEAIEILKARFGKKLVVISSHMDALMKTPSIKSIHDTRGLRSLYDKVENHIRSLSVMGIGSKSYGCLLVPVIMSRLPEELKLILTRTLDPDADSWEMEDLLREFQKEVEARERVAHVTAGELHARSGENFSAHKNTRPERSEKTRPPTAAGLLTTDQEATCIFCSGKHFTSACTVVTEVATRREILLKSGRCFVCLGKGHMAKKCKSKKKCAQCKRRHHRSLCEGPVEESAEEVEDTSSCLAAESHVAAFGSASGAQVISAIMQASGAGAGAVAQASTAQASMAHAQNAGAQASDGGATEQLHSMLIKKKSRSLLMTATVYASPDVGEVRKVAVRLVIDGGSHKSYITSDLQRKLGLKNMGTKILNVGTFGETTGKVKKSETVQLRLTSLLSEENIVITASTTPVICPPIDSSPVDCAFENFHHLRGLEFADRSDCTETDSIDVLVGQDYYWIIMENPIIRGEVHEPVAQLSIFGWVLSGPVPDGRNADRNERQLLISTEEHDPLTKQLERFWTTENFGILETEDEQVHRTFLETIKHNGERYEVSLPWRKGHIEVGDNFALAKGRLSSLSRKLHANAELKREYVKTFNDQLEKGIIEKVLEEKPPPRGLCYYMPHHPVVRMEKETTKVRVVYDASSKTRGASLNEALHQGPSLLPEIFKVLIRFRWHRIALIADIEKAFLNISVASEDRDFLRFLWCNYDDQSNPEISIYRFTRVVFGVTSSPYHLNATIRYHLSKFRETYPHVVEEILNSLYVDDFLGGGKDVVEGEELYRSVPMIMNEAGLHMRKWATNSPELSAVIEANEKVDDRETEASSSTYASSTIMNPEVCESDEMKKVLGVLWDTLSDELRYSFSKLGESMHEFPKTKRGLLGVIAKIYDPLGLVSPVTVRMKASFQTLCLNKAGWDEPLDEELVLMWDAFCSQMSSSKSISFPKCYLRSSDEIVSVQLHTFSDASDLAYAAISYLRIVQGNEVYTVPVTAKARVAPLKMLNAPRQNLTTPRLELLAAVIASKLAESVKSVLDPIAKIESAWFWSDAMTVLYWIRGCDKQYKQFVENRLFLIRSRSDVTQWQHVPGEENPADIGSRGVSIDELADSDLWRCGPSWLSKDQQYWPKSPKLDQVTPEVLNEMKRDVREDMASDAVMVNTSVVMECETFGSLGRLLRVTAYVMRFVRNMKLKLKSEEMHSGMITVEEVNEAELYWIRSAQVYMKNDATFSRKEKQFDMYPDGEGIIRCHGRLKNADIPTSANTPIALPHQHWLSQLIVRDCHNKVFHNGVQETVNLVKSKYFIPRCRQIAKNIIKKCVICKLIDGKPYNWRIKPPLPDFRVSVSTPFSTIGVDLAGPVYVKERLVDEKLSHKAYIVLFTCAGTRAIHLEIADDCSSERYIRALRRMMGRRGKPTRIISDNATNFKAKETREFLLSHSIKWEPIIANAPWMGGMYERMIRSVKRCLKKVLRNARLTMDELNTIVIEVECIVNNRPLTYVDNDDLNETVTPNHLILGQRISTLQDNLYGERHEPLNTKNAKQRFLYKHKILCDFRNRWSKDYLLELRDISKKNQVESKQSIAIGDVVLIEDDGPRLQWKLGKVIELIKSKDGEYRAAKIKVTGANIKSGIIERPIRRLYPLELDTERKIGAHAPSIKNCPQTEGNKNKNMKLPEEREPLPCHMMGRGAHFREGNHNLQGPEVGSPDLTIQIDSNRLCDARAVQGDPLSNNTDEDVSRISATSADTTTNGRSYSRKISMTLPEGHSVKQHAVERDVTPANNDAISLNCDGVSTIRAVERDVMPAKYDTTSRNCHVVPTIRAVERDLMPAKHDTNSRKCDVAPAIRVVERDTMPANCSAMLENRAVEHDAIPVATTNRPPDNKHVIERVISSNRGGRPDDWQK